MLAYREEEKKQIFEENVKRVFDEFQENDSMDIPVNSQTRLLSATYAKGMKLTLSHHDCAAGGRGFDGSWAAHGQTKIDVDAAEHRGRDLDPGTIPHGDCKPAHHGREHRQKLDE